MLSFYREPSPIERCHRAYARMYWHEAKTARTVKQKARYARLAATHALQAVFA